MNFIKSYLSYGMLSFLQRSVGFITLPIMTRYLSPEDYGVNLLLTNSAAFLIFFLGFGLDSAFMLFFSRERDINRKKKIASTVYFARLLSHFPLSILAIYFYKKINIDFLNNYTTPEIVIYFSLWHLVSVLTAHFCLVLRAMEEHKNVFKFNFYSVLTQVILSLVLVVFFNLKADAIILANLISSLFLLPFFYKNCRKMILLSFDFDVFKKLLKHGFFLYLSSFCYYFVNQTSAFYIAKFISLKETGLYSFSMSIASIITLFMIGFNQIWAPYVQNRLHLDRKNEFILIHKNYCSLIIIAALALSLFSPYLVHYLARPNFQDGQKYIPLMILVLTIYSMSDYFDLGISYTKKSYLRAYIGGTYFLIFLLLSFPLTSYFGVFGLLLAQGISYLTFGYLINKTSQKLYYISYEWKKIILLFFIDLLLFTSTSVLNIGKQHIFFSIISCCALAALSIKLNLISIKRISKYILKNYYFKREKNEQV